MSSTRSLFALTLREPFRVFFPLATLLGISGVSLWPLYFSGLHKFYPGAMHARLMIEGFLAGFVLGFLGTALPRLLSAPSLRRGELWALVALYLMTAGLHIGQQPRLGDVSFILLLVYFGVCMLARVRSREDLPPPGFILVGLGLTCGLLGPILWLAGSLGWASGTTAVFGAMLLHQAFGILLLLGVGSFLLPRFLGIPEASTPARSWRTRAMCAGGTGVALLTSYYLEAAAVYPAAATWMRAIAAFVYLAATVPFLRQSWPLRTVPLAAQLSLVALIAGLAFPLVWPMQRLAGLHIVFLGGFSLIIFTVATRVVLGHSGNEKLFETRLPSLQIAALLLLTGTVLRAVGDFLPTGSHWLNGASYLWMIAAAIWGFAILPKVRLAGDC